MAPPLPPPPLLIAWPLVEDFFLRLPLVPGEIMRVSNSSIRCLTVQVVGGEVH